LQATYREPNIVTTIKVRLEWAGHLVRMSDDRTVKKVFLWKPDRKVGRPKLRWLDGTQNDLKFTGAKRWRTKAEDRSLWAIILKEALVKLQGLHTKEGGGGGGEGEEGKGGDKKEEGGGGGGGGGGEGILFS
jgi:hypothetical protein